MGVTTNGVDPRTDRKRAATRAELHVRSLSPGGCRERQAAVIERLQELESRGVIGRFDIQVWGTGVPVDGPLAATEASREKLRQVALFERWARETSVSLAIHTRELTPAGTDEPSRELRIPTMSLVEFRGSELWCVSPHTHGDGTRTVTDRLRVLERDADSGERIPGRTSPTAGTRGPIERVAQIARADE